MKRVIGVCAIAVSATAYAAMPNFDVKQHCSEVASFGGNPSEVIRQACYQQEQEAYNELKPNWDRLPATTRGHCDEVASFGGPGSYMILNACVQQESAARSSNDTFTFQK